MLVLMSFPERETLMADKSKLFRATSRDAAHLMINLHARFPGHDFSLSRTSYPTYNDISCFEIRCNLGIPPGVDIFIEGYIMGFHSAPA